MSDDIQLTFDPDEVLRWYDNDHEAIHELVALVRQDLPRYVASLEAAADAGDLAQVGRFAHTIKGAVGNVCALKLCSIAEGLEQAARSDDAARVTLLRPAFRDAASALSTGLGAWVQTLKVSGETAA